MHYKHKTLALVGLILAGEAIFALPFHIARFFRPMLLEVFVLTPTQLGLAQGMYGIIAMIAYFPGGILADRFAANKLMAMSLWMTALGGLYMSTFPSVNGSIVLFGFFGMTTIMLFWGSLIRATRLWGDIHQQGLAFGILEGGRGLLAVVLASLGIYLFQLSFPSGYDLAGYAEKKEVLRIIILAYTLVTSLIGLYVWFALKTVSIQPLENIERKSWNDIVHNLKNIIALPSVWLLSLIVICAYTGYKGFDNYALFAVDVYHYNDIEAARLVTLAAWTRPVAAVAIGLLADKINPVKMLFGCFATLCFSHLYFAVFPPNYGIAWLFIANILLTCIVIFGLRSLYFAVFESVKIPFVAMGTAVGFVSVIGFTPDIFVLYVAGYFIDNFPGINGHQYFFIFLASFSFIGMMASILLTRCMSNK